MKALNTLLATLLFSSGVFAEPGITLSCAPKAVTIAKKILQLNSSNAQTQLVVQDIATYLGETSGYALAVTSTVGNDEKVVRVEFDSADACQIKAAKIVVQAWQH